MVAGGGEDAARWLRKRLPPPPTVPRASPRPWIRTGAARQEEGRGRLFLQPLATPATQCTRGQLSALPALPDVTAFQVPQW